MSTAEPPRRMHPGQASTDADLARRLLAGQHPELADLPLRPVSHHGTDHDVYRLGDDLSLRLPRTGWAAEQAVKEATWLPRLAPLLPVAVPEVVALGEPAEGYPHPWSVPTWLRGTDAAGMTWDDGGAVLADDLAAVIHGFRSLPTAGGPLPTPGARGGDLAEHDDAVATALAALAGRVDVERLARAWAQSRAAVGPPVEGAWTHGDLLPGNLLVTDGRLSGLIDFGALKVADPALDLLPCWHVLDDAAAGRLVAAVGASEDDRLRARGWALVQAVIALPYYWETNPGIVAQSLRGVRRVVAEID